MKLCPQCDFIYEDEQSFCDMDGNELFQTPASEPAKSRLTIPLVPDTGSTDRRSSSIAVATMVVLVLAGLVVAVYFARARQTLAQRSQQPSQYSRRATEQAVQPSAQAAAAQPFPAMSPESRSSEQPIASTSSVPGQPNVDSTPSGTSPSETSPTRSRLNSGPVSASSGTENSRGRIVIRLMNGSAIKADEAWEDRNGIWYRQAGMVTLLKRSRVRSIERVATPPKAGNAVTTNNAKQSGTRSGTRDQLRPAKLEPVKPKKESRVTSFLKKTGNLIKKPFRH